MEKNELENSTRPMRIAHIMGKLWAGGVEAVVFNYYRAIDKTKYQFDFYYDADSTVSPPEDLIKMGARFYKIPPYQQLGNYLCTLKKYLKKNNYLIVHSHINTLSVFPLYAARKAGIPIRIAHNHSVPGGNEFRRNAMKKALRLFAKLNATDYFACSEKAGRWMFGNRAFEKGEVFIMKNAINFELFKQPESETMVIKQKYNLKNKFIVGHVGRFTFAKNHDFLLDIFKEIKQIRNDAVLFLVGDGELRDKINKKIKDLSLENSVIMTGNVSNAYKYYSVMDVLILPSIFEGLSMTTVEAQAAEKNILISSAIPNEAIISDGCYYMSDTASAKDWALKAIEVSGHKLSFSEKRNDYNIENAVIKLQEKYSQLLARIRL